MGQRLLMYYKYVGDKHGLDGKRQLAFATGLPSILAATEPDSQEKLQAFKKAVEEITQQPAPEF